MLIHAPARRPAVVTCRCPGRHSCERRHPGVPHSLPVAGPAGAGIQACPTPCRSPVVVPANAGIQGGSTMAPACRWPPVVIPADAGIQGGSTMAPACRWPPVVIPADAGIQACHDKAWVRFLSFFPLPLGEGQGEGCSVISAGTEALPLISSGGIPTPS